MFWCAKELLAPRQNVGEVEIEAGCHREAKRGHRRGILNDQIQLIPLTQFKFGCPIGHLHAAPPCRRIHQRSANEHRSALWSRMVRIAGGKEAPSYIV